MMGKKSTIEVEIEEGATITQLLEKSFDAKYNRPISGTDRQLYSVITILVNGTEIKLLEGMDTALNSGDEVTIFPS